MRMLRNFSTVVAVFMSILISGMAFGQTTITKRVAASTDDAEEYVIAQSIKLSSGDLELSEEGTTIQIIGMRFNDLVIPAFSTITNAYIEFVTDESNNTDPSILSISGQDIDNAPTFTDIAADISSRTQTTSNVAWVGEPQWLVVGETHQTPDISSVIQEIYDRAGWISGNSMAIFVEGTGQRVADSYDGNAAGAALLSITYTTCPVAVTGIITLPSTPGGSDGAVDITATGTSGSYTYSWSNGATTEDISGLSTGTYTVDVTDTVNGCTVSESFEVEFTADLSITKTVSNPSPAVGELITYTVSLTNNGAADATGVVITDVLPAGVSWLSDDSSGAYVPGTGVWTVGSLSYTNTTTLVVNATVTGTVGSTYTNTASVTSSDQIDNVSANDSGAVDITVSDVDLLIEKTVNDQTVDVGQEITYTIKVTNNGTSTATGIDIQETLPAGVTFVALSSNPGLGTYNETTHVWDLGTIAAGQNETLQFAVTIDAGTAGDVITNTASVLAVDQTDAHSIADTFESVTVFAPDILITKAVDDATPDEGQLIAYTITAQNVGTGATPATGLVVNDDLPAGVTFNLAGSTIPAGTTYDPVTGLWDIGTLIDNVALTLVLAVTVDAGTNGTTLTNTASVESLNEPVQGTAVDTESVDILVNAPDLLVTKSVDDDTPDEGQTITYTVNVRNLGPALATGVEITDLLPAGLTFVSSTQELLGTYDDTTGLWVLGGDITVAGNNTITLTITATVDGGTSGTTITNTASVSSLDQTDPNAANDSASVAMLVNPADLWVTKSVDDPTPNEGQLITYTVIVRNLGPAVATGIVIEDILPVGVTFDSITLIEPAGATYDPVTGLWDVGATSLLKDQEFELQIAAIVDAGTSGTTITNTASVSALDQGDTDPSNDSASAPLTVNAPDLEMTKSIDDDTPDEGQLITYTVNVKNAVAAGGPSATNVLISDLLPAGLTFVSATPEQGSYDSGTGIWTVGTINSAQSFDLVITATVDGGTSNTIITNTASVFALDQGDLDPSNDSASEPLLVNTTDLNISKSVDDTTPDEGQTLTYTISVQNQGPSIATGVLIEDILPAGVTFVSATPEQGSYDAVSGIWTVGTIPFNITYDLVITVTVDGGTSNTTITNTASVNSVDQGDDDPTDDSESIDVLVNPTDLHITKSVSDTTPDEGQTITYTVSVQNQGPSIATGVLIDDFLPAGVTFVSAAPEQGSYDAVTGIWTVGTIPFNITYDLVITATVNLGTSGVTITNTASVSALDQGDDDPTDDSDSAPMTVNFADLEVTKSIDDTTPDEGQLITYTISVKNNGPAVTTGVVIEDILPPTVTFDSISLIEPVGASYDPVTGLWNVGTIPVGTTYDLQIAVTINSNTSSTDINNTASVFALDQGDDDPTNDTASIEVTVNTADLQVTKSVDDPAPDEGQTVTYTINVDNNGPSIATGVEVSDLLPAGVTLVSATPEQGTYDSVTGLWDVGTITIVQNFDLVIVATVDSGTASQTITNTASVEDFDQVDKTTANDSESVDMNVNGADLALTKSVDNSAPSEGQTVVFTITVTNNGPLVSNDVVITDLLPAGLTYVSHTVDESSYTSGTGVWGGTDLDLLVAEVRTLTITATVDVGTKGTVITNTATVISASLADSNTANNTATALVAVGEADLMITKSVDDLTPNEGDPVQYTITVTNNGPDLAADFSIDDLLPAGVTFVSATPDIGSYDDVTGVWDIGGSTLAVGASISLLIDVSVDAGTAAQTITNTATINANQTDSVPGDETASVDFQVHGADVEVVKTVSNDRPAEGDLFTYTLTVTNNGPDDTTNVEVTDLLPFGVTFQSAVASQGSYNSVTGVWTVGDLLSGQIVTLDIDAIIFAATTVDNTATVTASDQPDAATDNNSSTVTVATGGNFAAGSCIIDMGVEPRTEASHLKAYGLIYDLVINQQIPVFWSINPDKQLDGIDFSVGGVDYDGGPFIIAAEFVADAQATLDVWAAKGVVIDCPAEPFTAPIFDTVTSFPNAVVDKANGGEIISAFYDPSEVPESSYRVGNPNDLTSCDDIYAMPHADPHTWPDEYKTTLLDFVNNGGFLWAACHAASSLESFVDIDGDGLPDLNFLSNRGLIPWTDHSDGTPPYSYDATLGDDPYMQLIGSFDGALQNGSEQIYLPYPDDPILGEGGWRDSTTIAVWDPDHPEVLDGSSPGEAAVLVYGRAFGDPNAGMVMYEASHTVSGGSEAENVSAARAYANMLLQAGIESRPNILQPLDIPEPIDSGVTVPISAQIEGGTAPYTYQWSSSCGGSFADAGALSTTFTAPVVATDTPCILRMTVTDACGRTNFAAEPTTILAPVDPTLVKSADVTESVPGGLITYTLEPEYTGATPLVDLLVSDVVPVDTAYITGSANAGGVYDAVTDTVSWDLGSTALGELGIDKSPGTPITITLLPVADTYIDQGASTSNFGDDTFLSTKSSATDTERTLIKYDLSQIPVDATLQSADFRINVTINKSDQSVGIHALTTDWTELGSSWGNSGFGAWSSLGGDFDPTAYASFVPDPQGYAVTDVTTLASGWMDGSITNFGLLLDDNLAAGSEAHYDSRETEDPPQLVITYIPQDIQTITRLTVDPLLVSDSGQVTVTMEVTAPGATTDITVTPPATLAVSQITDATFSLSSGPSPATDTLPLGGSVTFTYVYDVGAGTLPDALIFSGSPTSASASFVDATSDSTLVIPLLSFQIQVDAGLDPTTVTEVTNIAQLSDGFAFTTPIDSNEVIIPILFEADLAVTKTDGLIEYLPGTTTIYTIAATNNGPDNVTGASITDAFPAGTTGVWTCAGFGTSCPNASGSGDINETVDLPVDSLLIYTVTLSIPSSFTGDLTNTVVITPPTDVFDPVPENNTDTDIDLESPRMTIAKVSNGGIETFSFVNTNTVAAGDSILTATAGIAALGTTTSVFDSSQDVTITETILAGWNLSSASCVDNNSATTGNPGSFGSLSGNILTIANANLLPGADIVCQFTNDKLANLTIIKTAVGGGAAFDFTATGLTPATFTLNPNPPSTPSVQQSYTNILPGTDITIAELDNTSSLSLFVLVNMTCTDNGATGTIITPTLINDGTTAGTLAITNLVAGADLICTFINVKDPEIILIKNTVGGDEAFPFTLTSSAAGTAIADPAPTLTTTSGSTALNTTVSGLKPNGPTATDITITETDPDPLGFELTDLTCTTTEADATTDPLSYSVDLLNRTATITNAAAGDVITCTYTNTKLQSITIAKETIGDVGSFDFNNGTNGLPSALTLTTTAQSSPISSTPYTVDSVTTDASITEVLPTGWALQSVTCLDSTSSVVPTSLVDTTLTVASAELASSGDITCTFVNEVIDGMISGIVLEDIDGNGTGDNGIEDVIVQLWQDTNSDGVPDTLYASTTTFADGSYTFADVPIGDYVLVEIDPSGYITASDVDSSDDGDNVTNSSTLDNRIPVTITSGEDDVDNIFVDIQPGNITGTVWLDGDGDGVEDIGEPGIMGVTVYLCLDGVVPCDASTALATAVTDVNGDYNFPNLAPDNYQVQVDPNELSGGELDGLDETAGNLGGSSGTIILPLGGTEESDFGYVPDSGTAVVEGTIWSDADGDSIQDPGEVGIEGVTVNLWEDTDGDSVLDTIVGTATTGSDGSYQVSGITFAGDEITDGRELVAIVDTTDPELIAFCDPTAIADCDTTPTQSDPITVMPNDVVSDVDFGFDTDSSFIIQDRIWYDENGDGVFDAGEQGIGGVSVDLLDSTGNVIASVITNSDGSFSFEGIVDGDYEIQLSDNSGELNSFTETTGTGGSVSITVNATTTNGDGILDTVGDDGTPSFGYNAPGTISGTVFSDPDNSGTLDSDETGIEVDAVGDPIIVELQDGVCTPGVDCPTTTVNPDGSYKFSGLPPDDYTVVVTNPPAGTNTTSGDTQNVTIGSGESAANIDFGYNNPTLSDISGTVFEDLDSDGTHEPDGTDGDSATTADNEPGLDGVTIELLDCGTGTCFDGDETIVATTTTAADGSYTFADVPDGDYLVQVTDSANVLDGFELTSGLDQAPVTADSGTGDVTDIDFGYVGKEQTAVITSGLWIDTDKDGVRDPDETPIPNVDINLIDCGSDAVCGTADDVVVGTATTDAEGNVIFDELPPGNYQLVADTTDPEFPSDLDETTYSGLDPNAPISLSKGESYDADFGYIPTPGTAGFAGTIWNDSEPDGSVGDGIKDASEVGLGGIPIILANTETGDVLNTITAPDGSYVFTGLVPCSTPLPCYQVIYYEPSVSALGLDGVEPTNTPDENALDGTTTPDGINDNIYFVHLEDGDFKEDHDFGFDAPANTFGAIDGFTYFEPAPANGDRDAGTDPGIESVTVNLVDSNGDVIASTTTSDGFTDVDGDGVIDPAGYYSFTNLVAGDYTVVVTNINNATIGLNPTENPTGISPTLTVAAGGLTSADFGYMGEQNRGNIGSLIWLDVGGPSLSDGMFDSLQGDKGMVGVTVECWFDADGDKLLTIAGEDNLIRTVTTDSNGEYNCEGLPTGGYLVRVTDDAGRLTGSIAAKVIGGTGTYTPGTGPDDVDGANKMAIPLASIPTSGPSPAWYIQTGSDNLTADFAVTGTNNLSGVVFEEEAGTTANGLLDGSDAGTSGVTVILLVEQPDGTFLELTRTTTDTNGDYNFSGLPNSNYQVVVDTDGSSINGYGQTGDPDIPGGFCTSALSSICDDKAGSVTPIALTGGSVVTDVDFGYQTEFVTTPITLGYFHAQSLGGDAVEINWQTVTEVAHLGFNLYVRERISGETKRRWRRLNTELIAPAAPGDSFDVREYSFTAYGVDGQRFALGDVDVAGKETLHGPFKLNRKAGSNRADRTVTNWTSIKAKRKAKAEVRAAKRKAQAQKRLHKALQKSNVTRDVQPLKRGPQVNLRKAKSAEQMQQEFEMLELDNEQCEMANCFGDDVGQRDNNGDSKRHSLTSRLVAVLVALIVPSAHALEPAIDSGVIEIETTEAGIYKVTYDDLFDQGVDIRDVLHRDLSLTNNNKPVYIRSWGQRASAGNRRYFGPGGGFEFVAEANRTLYTKSNVYSLHVGGPKSFRKTIRANKAALPVAGTVVDYYQETTVLEPEVAYSTLSPNGDPWFGFQATSNGADKTITIPYRVDNFAPGKGVVETQLQAWGMTTGSHEVSISANGQQIDAQQFLGITPVTLSGQISSPSLADGVNTYSLTIPGRGVMDQLALDKWQVTYPRWTIAKDSKTLEFKAAGEIISVSGLKSKWVRIIRENAKGIMRWIPYGRMQRIRQADGSYTLNFPGTAESASYYVSVITNADRRIARLRLPVVQDDLTSGNASYLIVAHPDFIDANMDRFVSAKQAQGFSVKVADVEAVYTTFGAGHFGAEAIRAYIDWAHDNLGTEMMLLVGDDMFDYHSNQYGDAISFIPSIYTATSALVNMAPVDAKYVDFNNDDIPDIPIGRLNPKLTQEWAAMVDKTLSYGQHPNPQSIVFSADGFDAAQGYDFSADADHMLSRLPTGWQSGVSKFYIDDLGVADARNGLLAALDAGPAVTAFVGHSGPRDWSFLGLLSAADATALSNNGAPTVVTQWGCWNTYYATPNGSLANEFLRNPNGGAAAVLGAIALTEADHEKELAVHVFDRLFQPGMTIGDAVLQAKQAYALDHPVATHKDVILGWTLLADPSLVIQR